MINQSHRIHLERMTNEHSDTKRSK